MVSIISTSEDKSTAEKLPPENHWCGEIHLWNRKHIKIPLSHPTFHFLHPACGMAIADIEVAEIKIYHKSFPHPASRKLRKADFAKRHFRIPHPANCGKHISPNDISASCIPQVAEGKICGNSIYSWKFLSLKLILSIQDITNLANLAP